MEGQRNNVNKIKSPSGSCKTVQIKRPNGFVINNKQTSWHVLSWFPDSCVALFSESDLTEETTTTNGLS